MQHEASPHDYDNFRPQTGADGVAATQPETGTIHVFQHEEILNAHGHGPETDQSGPARKIEVRDEASDEYLPPTPVPEAEAPAGAEPEPQMVPEPAPEPAEEQAEQPPAEESRQVMGEDQPASEFIKNIGDALAASEAKTAELDSQLQAAKQEARAALDNDQFDKAQNLTRAAKSYSKKLEAAKSRREYLKKRHRFIEDVLNPPNILDLKEKFDAELDKEKSRRQRLQDQEPIDSYAEMLKNHLVDKYFQTGVPDGESRQIPPELKQELIALMDQANKGYKVTDLRADRSEEAAEPNPIPEPEPTPEPLPESSPEPEPTPVVTNQNVEPLPESSPEPGLGPEPEPSRGGFWNRFLGGRSPQDLEASRGGRGRSFRRIGRAGRRGAQDSERQS